MGHKKPSKLFARDFKFNIIWLYEKIPIPRALIRIKNLLRKEKKSQTNQVSILVMFKQKNFFDR